MAALQAPGRIQSGRTVDIKLDLVDAIAVGQSIRTLIRARQLPPGTAEFYERVANQILSAARLEIQDGAR